jgi:hypothetical protein
MAYGRPFPSPTPAAESGTDALPARVLRDPPCCQSEFFMRLLTVSYEKALTHRRKRHQSTRLATFMIRSMAHEDREPDRVVTPLRQARALSNGWRRRRLDMWAASQVRAKVAESAGGPSRLQRRGRVARGDVLVPSRPSFGEPESEDVGMGVTCADADVPVQRVDCLGAKRHTLLRRHLPMTIAMSTSKSTSSMYRPTNSVAGIPVSMSGRSMAVSRRFSTLLPLETASQRPLHPPTLAVGADISGSPAVRVAAHSVAQR